MEKRKGYAAEAVRLLREQPARIGRMCGFTLLTDELHGLWMRDMIGGKEDMTLLSHRGSYKTTCLSIAIAVLLVTENRKNLLFMRKTDDDVAEVMRQVRMLLEGEVFQTLSREIYGTPIRILRANTSEMTTDCFLSPRGAVQLSAQGVGGSLTGKHADIIFTDDIVNTEDRYSPAAREKTRAVYAELQNIRNRGGRIINTGTPWHKEDAISLMPNVRRFDCYTTGLITPEELERLKAAMDPEKFAANYELRMIPSGGVLFMGDIQWCGDEKRLLGAHAHIDAAYGGGDYTALTIGSMEDGQLLLYGRLYRRHVDDVLEEMLDECRRFRCSFIHMETNGDKGYLARKVKEKGFRVMAYSEGMNKEVKISTYLRSAWPGLRFLQGTDEAYIDQIREWTPTAAHDDAPDSAACMARILGALQ